MAAPIKAARSSKKPSRYQEVAVTRTQVLFTSDSAEGALRGLADWWVNTPEGGEALSDRFEFVADDHIFTVTVEPLPPPRVDEPGEDWAARDDRGVI